jgi:hypothetical protein
MFIETLLPMAKLQKQPKCLPTDEWIKNMWYTYKMNYYSAIRNNDMGFESK